MGKKDLPADLNSLKVTDLKEALKERGLTVGGVKADLVARLQEFLDKQAPAEKSAEGGSTPQKQAEKQNGDAQEESVKETEKADAEKAKEVALQKEKEEKEKEKNQKEKEQKEKEQKEKELKEKEVKEKELKAKEQKEKEQKEKEIKEKELKAKELKEKEEKEKAQREKETSKKNEETEAKQEEKKRKTTDDTEPSSDTTPAKTATSSSTPASSTTKRPRTTWANKPQSINISTDILKEMLPPPSSPPTEDAEMGDSSTQDDTAQRRPTQQVYSAPSRREKKEEDSGPREVPAARKPASNTLFIDKFVRPFTIPQVKQLLAQTGELDYFWMNQVKSQAYATFKTVEQATATREAIFDLLWPPGNGSKLRAEFSSEDEAKKVAEQHDLKRSSSSTPAPSTTAKSNTPDARMAQRDLRDSREIRDSRDSRDSRDARNSLRDIRDRRAPPPPKKTLEDLFNKTAALPSIYWLGLTAEQIEAKKAKAQNDRT